MRINKHQRDLREMNFKEIDEILMNNSIVRYNFDILNPLNKEEEFKKFLKDPTYNPQFNYNPFDAHIHINKLEKLTIPTDSPLGCIFETIRQHLLIEATALHNIGTNNFDTAGLFTSVKQETLLYAQKILLQPLLEEVDEEKTISSVELAQKMKDQLNSYNCEYWSITFNKNAAARASVSAGRKTITIKSHELFTPTEIKKLLVHEIGTHVLRAINGSEQDYQIFSIGLPDYLATEEGLAGYNERLNGIEKKSTLRSYALSALITHLCAHHGFVDAYNQVRHYFKEDWDCFRAVARLKRGLKDTSKPGGYLKDHCYLEGMMLIEEFAKKGGDFKKLYAAKIGVQHIHLVDEDIIKPASVLPDFLKN